MAKTTTTKAKTKAAPKKTRSTPKGATPDARASKAKTNGTPERSAPREPSPTERHRTIAREAYYRAELRGFAPGHELEDWLAAEQLVQQQGL